MRWKMIENLLNRLFPDRHMRKARRMIKRMDDATKQRIRDRIDVYLNGGKLK